MAELDSPWKDAIEDFLGFVAFFFPGIFGDIDTSQDYESLEQELRKLVPESLTGKRVADKLVKLVTKAGDTRYLHIEIQGQPDDRFAERMEVYNSRAGEVLGQPVVSVALLVDDDPNWRPGPYHFSCWGCERSLKYLTRKVLDLAENEAELSNDPNP